MPVSSAMDGPPSFAEDGGIYLTELLSSIGNMTAIVVV